MTISAEQPEPTKLVWTRELVNRFWNGLSRAGHGDTRVFGRMARRSIHWLIARHLVKGGRHLDFGAGGGEIAEHLIDQGYPFAAIDPASDRAARADALLSGKAGYLPAPEPGGSETFDAVTCFEVLEHVLDDEFEGVCDTLAGLVKPGGRLIITTPNSEDLDDGVVYCPVANVTFHRWQHVRSITPAMMDAMFARRGFSKVCLHQLDFIDALYEPYLHMLGFIDRPLAEGEIIPLHIHNINHNIDSVIGGASSILYVGQKAPSLNEPSD
ncbi:class I SAM-dependent methyltransferase [Roseomonas sp. PWR1]|uniref:Class I SAM-dependent methyltransferase n=1 Tax=Roseomonas nitratireducens TaxID=2820810 RepID=A0ABS4AP19_9PROT|nr:class I SAM-dependent methyltransferase [Neoroseomonas nitratireducens]MBP0462566.1 class I SAM-dependent methyltransferase [Neoroseomonas nitratireducens]